MLKRRGFSSEIFREPLRYQNLVLWAWPQFTFTPMRPEESVLKGNTSTNTTIRKKKGDKYDPSNTFYP